MHAVTLPVDTIGPIFPVLPGAGNLTSPGKAEGGMMEKPYLTRADVARIGGEEVARLRGEDPANAAPLALSTITAHVRDSQPGSGRRFENHPMPLPVYGNDNAQRRGQIPLWWPQEGETVADLEARLRHWFASRRGRNWKSGAAMPQRGLLLAELLAHPSRERNLTELAEAAGIPRGTIGTLAKQLAERRWITVRTKNASKFPYTLRLVKLTRLGLQEGPAELARMQAAATPAEEDR